MGNIVFLYGGKDSDLWRKGKDCDYEHYTKYFDKSRGKERIKWVKYSLVSCSVCGINSLKLKSHVKKHPKHYCSDDCRSKAISIFYSGKNHMSYKSGKFEHEGYIFVKSEDHPRSKHGYVPEHILIAESKIGRLIARNEHVHHINENRSDNRPENLQVMTIGEHRSLHVLKNKPWENSPTWKKRRCQNARE